VKKFLNENQKLKIETKIMKELSTDDLFNLAWSELDKMKRNSFAGTILCFIVIFNSLFVFLTGKGLTVLILVDIFCGLLYFYHNTNLKMCDRLVKEILKEIDKRES